MSRETHLAALGQRHDALDKEITKELAHPAKDEVKLAEMKRRKLQLRMKSRNCSATVYSHPALNS